MVTGYVLKRHLGGDLLLIAILGPPRDFLHHYDLLLPRDLQGERRASLGRIDLGTIRHGRLDVLRGMLRSPNDNRILHAAGDKKLAIFDEAEIAGPQIGPWVGFDP